MVEFGEALDFWRVVGIDRDRSLALRAEMKLPGEAQLDFQIEEIDAKAQPPLHRLVMTARFRPRGLLGLLYWYAVVPLHELVFGGMLRGIQKTAEALQRAKTLPGVERAASETAPGYGRARLWLGMSGVGTIVVLAVVALLLGLPARFLPPAGGSLRDQFVGLVGFVLAYAAVHVPFDVYGGYLLPRRYGRRHLPLGSFVASLTRGVGVHSGLMFAGAVTLLVAGRAGGAVGVIAAAAALVPLLLGLRIAVAAALAPLELTPSLPSANELAADDRPLRILPTFMAESDDEGFTGAVVGVMQPRLHLLPLRWRGVLDTEAFATAVRRRQMAIESGAWWRGRMLAIGFTMLGIALAALVVGDRRLATAEGIITFSLVFTLWSFLGLLTLPTPSRRGVEEVDRRLLAAGCRRATLARTIETLDDLQDRERERTALVETIFHPVPSVEARLRGPHATGVAGFWDAARTAVYLSLAGLGLLGRAVHCNCGRPSLWAFLPID